MNLTFFLLQYVWMEHYLVITCIVDSGAEQTVGLFSWRFVTLNSVETKYVFFCDPFFLFCYLKGRKKKLSIVELCFKEKIRTVSGLELIISKKISIES